MLDLPIVISPTPDYVIGVKDGGAVLCPIGAGLNGGGSTRTTGLIVGTVTPGQPNAGVGGGGGTWGSITGTLASQSDLNTALGLKATAASPALSGTGTGSFVIPATYTMAASPTQADNSLKIATTAYVDTLGATKAIGGLTITSAATSITVVAATHNGNVLATTATTAVSVVLNTGAALTNGMVIVQRGANPGIVTLGGTATFVSPNGLTTSGPNTTLTILPTETTDTYLVLVAPTADRTLVNATAGATPAVDMSKYNVVDLTLTANCTPAFSGAVSGQMFSVTLIIRQDATGSRTLTLPTTKWAGGTAYATTGTASSIDVITLSTIDGGTTYLGFVGGKAFA